MQMKNSLFFCKNKLQLILFFNIKHTCAFFATAQRCENAKKVINHKMNQIPIVDVYVYKIKRLHLAFTEFKLIFFPMISTSFL